MQSIDSINRFDACSIFGWVRKINNLFSTLYCVNFTLHRLPPQVTTVAAAAAPTFMFVDRTFLISQLHRFVHGRTFPISIRVVIKYNWNCICAPLLCHWRSFSITPVLAHILKCEMVVLPLEIPFHHLWNVMMILLIWAIYKQVWWRIQVLMYAIQRMFVRLIYITFGGGKTVHVGWNINHSRFDSAYYAFCKPKEIFYVRHVIELTCRALSFISFSTLLPSRAVSCVNLSARMCKRIQSVRIKYLAN